MLSFSRRSVAISPPGIQWPAIESFCLKTYIYWCCDTKTDSPSTCCHSPISKTSTKIIWTTYPIVITMGDLASHSCRISLILGSNSTEQQGWLELQNLCQRCHLWPFCTLCLQTISPSVASFMTHFIASRHPQS